MYFLKFKKTIKKAIKYSEKQYKKCSEKKEKINYHRG